MTKIKLPKRPIKEILSDNEKRERLEKEWWSRLESIQDPKQFFNEYANYLEWCGIYSNYRKIIYDNCKKL